MKRTQHESKTCGKSQRLMPERYNNTEKHKTRGERNTMCKMKTDVLTCVRNKTHLLEVSEVKPQPNVVYGDNKLKIEGPAKEVEGDV